MSTCSSAYRRRRHPCWSLRVRRAAGRWRRRCLPSSVLATVGCCEPACFNPQQSWCTAPRWTACTAAENKKDVDNIHEFLLVKGVEAVAVHGSKDQEEREWAIQSFKAGMRRGLLPRAG